MRLLSLVTLALALAAAVTPASALALERPPRVHSGGPMYDPARSFSALYYAKTAYCDSGAITAWNCATCGFHPLFGEVHVVTFDDAQAYTGWDASRQEIVVAFRGSSNIPNWISDLTYEKVPYPPCAGACDVHEGFFSLWTGLAPLILPSVRSMLAAHPGAPLFVTGHSLGAAISILAALELEAETRDRTVYLYNFGEPRVGDPAFAKYAAAHLPDGYQFRVTHHRDPVPHVPPMDFGFLHTPHELFYNNDGNTSYITCADSTSAEDPNCSDQFLLPVDISDHLLYLGISTHCQMN